MRQDPKGTLHGGGFGLMGPLDEPRVWHPNDEDSRHELYLGSELERRFPYPRSLHAEVQWGHDVANFQ